MNNKVTLKKNDTSRSIERTIADVEQWRDQNPETVNGRETSLLLDKLNEALRLSFKMIRE